MMVGVNVTVTSITIQRSLKKYGFRSCVAAKKPLLTDEHKRIRYIWCKEREDWTLEQWGRVIWSDESRFCLFKSDGKQRVWRRVGERYDEGKTVSTVKFGGGGIMVWGVFTVHGVGPLIRCPPRVDTKKYHEMIDGPLLEYAGRVYGDGEFLFQQDNATAHVSKASKVKFREMNVTLMPWPAQSPDLNPIEHMWSYLDNELEGGTLYTEDECLMHWESTGRR